MYMQTKNKTTTLNKELLVKQFGEKISNLAHKMIWRADIAEEAAQEVWFEILKSIHTFKGKSNISTWIYTIAKRTILRYTQNEKVLSYQDFDTHFNQNEIEYTGAKSDKEQWVKQKCDYCLTAFCHCLNNEARIIFLFRDIVELDDAEIAQIMETSCENIRQIAHRSREKVKHFMQKDCYLIKSNANCRCRISKHIKSIELDKQYHKLREIVSFIDFFKELKKELPKKNYWKKLIK